MRYAPHEGGPVASPRSNRRNAVDLMLVPGDFVRLDAEPDWGVGQVQSVIGTRVTVNFEERGKVVIDVRHARLSVVAPEPPRRDKVISSTSSCSAAICTGRSRRHRQPLHRPRLLARRTAAAGRPVEVSGGRQHRWLGCRQARRMRRRRHSPARSEDQRIQSALSHTGAGSHCRLRSRAGYCLPAGRSAIRGAGRAGSHRGREDGFDLLDGQSQPGQRYARADRPSARGAKPSGYAVQPRNHNAVAAAISQGRADWGVTLDIIASRAGLGFLPVQEEQYDFIARGRARIARA